MTSRRSLYDVLIGNGQLRDILKRHDPILPPSPGSLAALEDAILARIDDRPQVSVPAYARMPVWMLEHSWGARVAVLSALLVVGGGFIVGRVSSPIAYEMAAETGGDSASPLLAFADENPAFALPEAPVGDDDDNQQ